MEIQINKINAKKPNRKISFAPPGRKYSQNSVTRKRGVSWARNLCEVNEVQDFRSLKEVPWYVASEGSEKCSERSHKSDVVPKSILKNKNESVSAPYGLMKVKREELKSSSLAPNKSKSKFYNKNSSNSISSFRPSKMKKDASKKRSSSLNQASKRPRAKKTIFIDNEPECLSVSDASSENETPKKKKKGDGVKNLMVKSSENSKDILSKIFETNYAETPKPSKNKTPRYAKNKKPPLHKGGLATPNPSSYRSSKNAGLSKEERSAFFFLDESKYKSNK